MRDNNEPAISVVMPVYNTESYIRKAIESVLGQTFQDFEFLIINNGSTDNSGSIIDEYAEQDSRIHVIRNEKNVIVSEARNRAIHMARGEYLCLIDSDDWMQPDMLEVMYNRTRETNAQYTICGYFMDYCIQGKNYSYAVCPDDHFYEQGEFRRNAIHYLTRTLLTVPWNKFYSLAYLRDHHIEFRNTELEDHHFNMDILMDVERVCMVGRSFYHYRRIDSELVYSKFLTERKGIIYNILWLCISIGVYKIQRRCGNWRITI